MALRHSRNAQRAWPALADTTSDATSGRAASRFAQDRGTRPAAAHDEGLHPQGDAFRVACRLFPGFSELPASFRVALDGYAPLFRPETGPLSQRERELIARAVSGRDAETFGAPLAGGRGECTASRARSVGRRA